MILEIELSDAERERILNHWFMTSQSSYRPIAEILASGADVARVSFDDIARVSWFGGGWQAKRARRSRSAATGNGKNGPDARCPRRRSSTKTGTCMTRSATG